MLATKTVNDIALRAGGKSAGKENPGKFGVAIEDAMEKDVSLWISRDVDESKVS